MKLLFNRLVAESVRRQIESSPVIHFEADLILSSREVESKVLRMAIQHVQFEYFFFDEKAKWRM